MAGVTITLTDSDDGAVSVRREIEGDGRGSRAVLVAQKLLLQLPLVAAVETKPDQSEEVPQ